MDTENKTIFPNIVFKFDKKWELKNWIVSSVNKVTYDPLLKWDTGGIPQEVSVIVEEGGDEEEIKSKIQSVFDNFLTKPKASLIMKDITERSQKRWNEAGEKCLLALSKMLDIPLDEFNKTYYACFTFARRIPFFENNFMFGQFSDFPNTASHEIMHNEFLKKYKTHCVEKGLSETQINHLKEILTVLLNEDLDDVLYLPDRGYDSHKKIRRNVLILYREHKKTGQGFVVFLDKVIESLKDQWGILLPENK